MDKDNSFVEGVIILIILIVITFLMPKGAPKINTNPATTITTTAGEKLEPKANSSYSRYIYIGTGNASYAYQSYEEYITIGNSGANSIDITGWQLKNAKGERTYSLGGTLQNFSSDTAIIPQATLFISPTGYNIFRDVVLKNGEEAIITTGQIGSQSPYKIVSFKENKCSGYLGSSEDYTFTPPLTQNCPRPSDEPGVTGLDSGCRQFIERLSYCRTPKFDTLDADGNICHNCVNGTLLGSSCVAFIKNHFNYGSCIAYHQNDPDFSGRTWRIFLGHGWEMWAERYESISLFDKLGKLVDYISY